LKNERKRDRKKGGHEEKRGKRGREKERKREKERERERRGEERREYKFIIFDSQLPQISLTSVVRGK